MASWWNKLVAETEPHDQIGLFVVVILLGILIVFPRYYLALGVVSLIIVVGVLADLQAHNWNH